MISPGGAKTWSCFVDNSSLSPVLLRSLLSSICKHREQLSFILHSLLARYRPLHSTHRCPVQPHRAARLIYPRHFATDASWTNKSGSHPTPILQVVRSLTLFITSGSDYNRFIAFLYIYRGRHLDKGRGQSNRASKYASPKDRLDASSLSGLQQICVVPLSESGKGTSLCFRL